MLVYDTIHGQIYHYIGPDKPIYDHMQPHIRSDILYTHLFSQTVFSNIFTKA